MTLTVAITGGIGSGKSTFSNEVLKKKLKLFDSDKQVHKIYKTPKKNFLEYLNKIGLEKAVQNKNINKNKIRNTIFTDYKIKKKLENYIFNIVRREREGFIKKHRRRNTKIIFFDIPLLFENDLTNNFDVVISIISSKKNRFQRLKSSKKISIEIFNNIIKSQTSDVVRKEKSDIVIYNNTSMENYIKKIHKALGSILPWGKL